MILDPNPSREPKHDPKLEEFNELEELTEEHLGFSALSDGLGFSKSLTSAKNIDRIIPRRDERAPLFDPMAGNKTILQKGIGAVSAGPVRFVKTNPQEKADPIATPSAARWSRAAAVVIDFILVMTPFFGMWLFLFGHDALSLALEFPKSTLLLAFSLFVGSMLLSESLGGQTLGKMILGIKVVEDDKYQKHISFFQSLTRIVSFLLGTGLFGAGLFFSFFDKKGRCWHDRMSGSIVRLDHKK